MSPVSSETDNNTAESFHARRAALVLSLLGVALVGLVVRVAWLQTAHATDTAPRAERQQHSTQTLHARRGSIFDRNGLMLAGTVQLSTLFVDPKFMYEQFEARGKSAFDVDLALEKIAELTQADADELVLAAGRDPDARYVPLVRGLSDEAVARLRALEIPGIGFSPEPRRVYPMGETAAHVIGTVGRDENGLEGLERVQEAMLAGFSGSRRTLRDKRRRSIASAAEGYELPEHGDHLVMTIDAQIQLMAEQELAKTVRESGASAGTAVVMDPHTGEILALANYPSYFPQYIADSTADARRNRAVVDPFEPGSMVKPFIVAGMIDRGLARLEETVDVGETKAMRIEIKGKGRIIRDESQHRQHLAVWDVLVKSSNKGMVRLGERIDTTQLRDLYTSFGFGSETGLGINGENPGDIPSKWGWGDKESAMFGYAVLVTPIQLCRGMAVLANGGRLVTPRLIAGRVAPGGEFEVEVSPDLQQEVIRPEVAQAVRRVLADGPIRGTSKRARLDRWNLFGKTATAHRFVNGKQSDNSYVSSFLGGGPYESPRLVIGVSIFNATKDWGENAPFGHHGGVVAAPTASRILERAFEYLGVPDSPKLPPAPPHIAAKLHEYESFMKKDEE